MFSQTTSQNRAILLLLAVALLAGPALCEQNYVTRYDLFAGYSYFNSPSISLLEHGMQFQFGMRPRTWYSIGFDYTHATGSMTLTPSLLPDALQATLGGQLKQLAALGRLPAGYALSVPTDSSTNTFAAGPQLAFRHFQKVTIFARPSMGAIRELATPRPSDPIAKSIVAGLTPSGKKMDWTGFFGGAVGMDLLLTHHFALRVQTDVVYDHLFNDILKNGRPTVRVGMGPCLNFGKNIAEK